jgi:hypothetical protein
MGTKCENHKKKLETNQPKQTEIKSSVSTLKDPKETGNQTETGKVRCPVQEM